MLFTSGNNSWGTDVIGQQVKEGNVSFTNPYRFTWMSGDNDFTPGAHDSITGFEVMGEG